MTNRMSRSARNHLLVHTSLAILLACGPMPAQAQDTAADETAEESGDKPKFADKLNALTEQLNAIAAKEPDSVEENGGEIEAAILSAAALDKASGFVCKLLKDNGEVFVLSEGARREVELAMSFKGQAHVIERLLKLAIEQPRGSAPTAAGSSARVAFLPAVGAIASLFSTLAHSQDTVAAIGGTISDPEVLATMVAGRDCGTTRLRIVNDAIPDSDAAGAPLAMINTSSGMYDQLSGIDEKKRTDLQKIAMSSYESFLKALMTPVDGRLPLTSITKAMSYINKIGTGQILQLKVEKSGGTLLKRKNLWTGLGASSLGVTAATIVSYRLSNSEGIASKGGVIYCSTTLANFRDIHKLKEKLPATAFCQPSGS